MDEKNLTAEELAAEQEALVEAKEDEVRAKVIEDFGFDPVDNADQIEKVVAKEMKHRKDLSAAIGQKIKHRTEANTLRNNPPKQEQKTDGPKVEDIIDKKVSETLEKRDLESLDYPDDLKAEIRKVASTQGISVKKAIADPYIQFKIEAYKKTVEVDDAAISRTKKGGGTGKAKFDIDNPPDVDMSTEAGRKEWDAWADEGKKQGF